MLSENSNTNLNQERWTQLPRPVLMEFDGDSTIRREDKHSVEIGDLQKIETLFDTDHMIVDKSSFLLRQTVLAPYNGCFVELIAIKGQTYSKYGESLGLRKIEVSPGTHTREYSTSNLFNAGITVEYSNRYIGKDDALYLLSLLNANLFLPTTHPDHALEITRSVGKCNLRLGPLARHEACKHIGAIGEFISAHWTELKDEPEPDRSSAEYDDDIPF